MIYSLTANDTFVIFDRVFTAFADDDVSTITLPEELYKIKTGKNNNTIFTQNMPGFNSDVVLRLMKGSSDDQFLANKLALFQQDLPSALLANGRFAKRYGNGEGQWVTEVYTLGGGIITKIPEGKENVSGDSVQSVAIYNMKFAITQRSIQ